MTQYKTSLGEVPVVEGLTSKEGWVNMKVQFLIDAEGRSRNLRYRTHRFPARRQS